MAKSLCRVVRELREKVGLVFPANESVFFFAACFTHARPTTGPISGAASAAPVPSYGKGNVFVSSAISSICMKCSKRARKRRPPIETFLRRAMN